MNFLKSMHKWGIFLLAVMLVSCQPNIEGLTPPNDLNNPVDDNNAPDFDYTIANWEGETADDAHLDQIGTEEDFYHELTTFTDTVFIQYQDNQVQVSCSNKQILIYQSGAYVTVDMQTHTVANVAIILSGKSENGGLKIYGEKKFQLRLNGVELVSQQGPAINCQCKKRMFIHLEAGTTNRLTDCSTYTTDSYYLSAENDEDRKGCFFAEGNMIFSGTGVLVVSGKYKHGIVSDGYFFMRPGVTLVVTEAAKNGIHIKGDEDDEIGVVMQGGLIYTNIASAAGKGLKTDLDMEVRGGKLLLNTSGNAYYDTEEASTTSSAGIKVDGTLHILGGSHMIHSTGTGGKGLNIDNEFRLDAGKLTITTTGGKYTYTSELTSSPKGVKADGDIYINGGNLNISVVGKSDGSEGLESKSSIHISGGEVYVYAYDDAINAASALNVSGGKVYAYAVNNDGIDSNGSINISGGLVLSAGSQAPESGIDVDRSTSFLINGGIVIAMGGTLQSNPSSNSKQLSIIYNGVSAIQGNNITLLNASNKPILTYEYPRTINGATILFSAPDISIGSSYTFSSNGTLNDYSTAWNGWYADGVWTNGNELSSVIPTATVTTIGNSTGPGGGGGPSGGGGKPW